MLIPKSKLITPNNLNSTKMYENVLKIGAKYKLKQKLKNKFQNTNLQTYCRYKLYLKSHTNCLAIRKSGHMWARSRTT